MFNVLFCAYAPQAGNGDDTTDELLRVVSDVCPSEIIMLDDDSNGYVATKLIIT